MKKAEMLQAIKNDCDYYIDEGIKWNSTEYKERYQYAKQISDEMLQRALGIASVLYTIGLQTSEENDIYRAGLIDSYCDSI